MAVSQTTHLPDGPLQVLAGMQLVANNDALDRLGLGFIQLIQLQGIARVKVPCFIRLNAMKYGSLSGRQHVHDAGGHGAWPENRLGKPAWESARWNDTARDRNRLLGAAAIEDDQSNTGQLHE